MENKTNLTFEEALQVMKKGGKVTRDRWTSGEEFVKIIKPNYATTEKATTRVFVIYTKNTISAFSPTNCDLLAEDWRIV